MQWLLLLPLRHRLLHSQVPSDQMRSIYVCLLAWQLPIHSRQCTTGRRGLKRMHNDRRYWDHCNCLLHTLNTFAGCRGKEYRLVFHLWQDRIQICMATTRKRLYMSKEPQLPYLQGFYHCSSMIQKYCYQRRMVKGNDSGIYHRCFREPGKCPFLQTLSCFQWLQSWHLSQKHPILGWFKLNQCSKTGSLLLEPSCRPTSISYHNHRCQLCILDWQGATRSRIQYQYREHPHPPIDNG